MNNIKTLLLEKESCESRLKIINGLLDIIKSPTIEALDAGYFAIAEEAYLTKHKNWLNNNGFNVEQGSDKTNFTVKFK